MSDKLKKRKLMEKLYQIAQEKETEMKRASKDAQERANEAEGAMISRYDTFKEEGQYLAGGLKIRYEELKSAVSVIEQVLKTDEFCSHTKIQMYSYVEVEFEDGTEGKFLITPVLGGEKLDKNITIITPNSPIGKSLMGQEEGQQFEYLIERKRRKGEIITVL
jgi:transcription elongation GreA/GreB family factor